MELKQLQYFAAIVEEGTISAAARRLNVSQPPVSLQMKLLEEEYGTPLFIRGRRKITLTEAGNMLYRYAVDILNLQKSAEEDLYALRTGRKRKIRLGMVSSSACRKLFEGFRVFRAERPDVEFSMCESNTYDLLHLLQEGRIDLAVIRTPYPDRGYEAAELSVDRIHAVWKKKENENPVSVSLCDLQNRTLLIYRRWEKQLSEAFTAARLSPSYTFVMDDARTCLQMAAEGIGTAFVPENIIPEDDMLASAAVTELSSPTHLRLVRRDDHMPNDAADAFFQLFASSI